MEVWIGDKEEREEWLGEGVVMVIKVVKGFKEKVINVVICLDFRKIRIEWSFLNFVIKGLLW